MMFLNIWMKQSLPRTLPAWCFVLLCLWQLGVPAGALADKNGDISAKVAVEKDTVSLGESFIFQIQLDGIDTPQGGAGPDMSGLADFSVESLGGQSNNRSSITIVNGKVNKVESFGYIHSYRLTPRKTGQLVIPPLVVPMDAAGAKTLRTQPVTIRVTPAEATDDFRLEVQFAKTQFYVGEPVSVSVIWYLNRDVKSVHFDLPWMETAGFSVLEPGKEQDPGRQVVQIPLGQSVVPAEKGRKILGGREYTTVSFPRVLLGKEPGTYRIPESTVSCTALVGYSKPGRSSNNPFDGFFGDDVFNMGRREVTKTFVARSQPVTLTVKGLPQEGKPSDFSGIVGRVRVETSANPLDVSVGDPITLTVSISGPEVLDPIELPSLSRDAELEKSFKIPEEMATGFVKDGRKIFTQTLRAKSDAVKAIPPIKISIFDPERGEYQVAAGNPIPIQVKPTRIVTGADVEGRLVNKPIKNELEAWSEGIAYNYEGPELLENQSLRLSDLVRSPFWLAGMTLPFAVYVLLFVLVSVRRRRLSDPDGARSRKALTVFVRRVKGMSSETTERGWTDLLDALRHYLGDKLRMDGAALTFADVEGILNERGIDAETARRLEAVFAVCEQGRYGGGLASTEPLAQVAQDALDVIRNLDRKI